MATHSRGRKPKSQDDMDCRSLKAATNLRWEWRRGNQRQLWSSRECWHTNLGQTLENPQLTAKDEVRRDKITVLSGDSSKENERTSKMEARTLPIASALESQGFKPTAINPNASMVGKSISLAQSRHRSPLPSSSQQALVLPRGAVISGACYDFNRSSISCGREVEIRYQWVCT